MRITGKHLRQIIREEISRTRILVRETPEFDNLAEDLNSKYNSVQVDLMRAEVPKKYRFESDIGVKDGEIIIMMTYYNEEKALISMYDVETEYPDEWYLTPIPEAESKMQKIAERYVAHGSKVFDIDPKDVYEYYGAHHGLGKKRSITGAVLEFDFFQGLGVHYIGFGTGIPAREQGFLGDVRDKLGI